MMIGGEYDDSTVPSDEVWEDDPEVEDPEEYGPVADDPPGVPPPPENGDQNEGF